MTIESDIISVGWLLSLLLLSHDYCFFCTERSNHIFGLQVFCQSFSANQLKIRRLGVVDQDWRKPSDCSTYCLPNSSIQVRPQFRVYFLGHFSKNANNPTTTFMDPLVRFSPFVSACEQTPLRRPSTTTVSSVMTMWSRCGFQWPSNRDVLSAVHCIKPFWQLTQKHHPVRWYANFPHGTVFSSTSSRWRKGQCSPNARPARLHGALVRV